MVIAFKKWRRCIVFLLFIFLNPVMVNGATYTKPANFSVDFQHMNLPDAIQYIAKLLDMNVILSPAVQGEAMLNLQHVQPHDALDILLLTYGLAKTRSGNIWLIAPQNELVKVKQAQIKWRDIAENTLPLFTEVAQIRYAKALDIARLLKSQLSKRGRLHADVRTNTICMQDVTARILTMRRLLHKLDVPLQQVVIAARLVSIDSDFEQELGVQFSTKNVEENTGNNRHANSSSDKQGQYSLAVATLPDGSMLDVKLIALENSGHAELISSPSLFAANQQQASIEAGEEVPYQEVSESGGTAVQFKKAVLGLKVTPQILPSNTIALQLQINQDRPLNKMVQGMPTISTRQIKTNILVKSGQTIVLGGIYEVNAENGQSGLPFLSRIPGLGLLFKQQNIRRNKRELLIFVTPKIMRWGG